MNFLKRKTNWVHVELISWEDLTETDYYSVKNILKYIYLKSYHLIKRKFYLFEGKPLLCFFAMELIERRLLKRLEYICKIIKEQKSKDYAFIKDIRVKADTDDGINGEGFLRVLDAVTDYNLIYEDTCDLTHIIHCTVNNSFMGLNEKRFYNLMAKMYCYGK